MKFVGLDLGGVNSLACLREDAGAESFQGSAHPERPSCVLLPLVRKEKLIAGDEAQRNERGSGMPWPPLAMAADCRGFSRQRRNSTAWTTAQTLPLSSPAMAAIPSNRDTTRDANA